MVRGNSRPAMFNTKKKHVNICLRIHGFPSMTILRTKLDLLFLVHHLVFFVFLWRPYLKVYCTIVIILTIRLGLMGWWSLLNLPLLPIKGLSEWKIFVWRRCPRKSHYCNDNEMAKVTILHCEISKRTHWYWNTNNVKGQWITSASKTQSLLWFSCLHFVTSSVQPAPSN